MTEIEAMIARRAKHSLSLLPEGSRANLVRLSAAYADDHVRWQVVVLDEADDDEIEEYACIFTEVLADFTTATGEESLVTLSSADEAALTPPLPISIYP